MVDSTNRRKAASGVWFQASLVAVAGLIGLAPPSEGAMLIAPIGPRADAESMRWATQAGARLIGRGPYAGAYFIWGERARLTAPALRHGSLLLTAAFFGCGTSPEKAL
jgi:hypothetical protein